jgi:hypothetical protein
MTGRTYFDRPTTMLWAGVGEDVLGVIRLMYAENRVFGTFLLLLLYSKDSDHQDRC